MTTSLERVETRLELQGVLRSPWDLLHSACATEDCPLTLTLSLREREQQASGWCLANGCWANSGTGVIERLWTILPLPRGEGRGEGEPRVAHPAVRSVRAKSFTELGSRRRRLLILAEPLAGAVANPTSLVVLMKQGIY